MARNLFGPSAFGRRGQPPVRRDPFLSHQRVAPQPQPQRTSGGLPGVLQKILRRGSRGAQTGARVALPATSSSSGGVSLLDMLNHTQSALRAAESFMPMVQEYGPMVKNLPSMFKMMKALKDINFDEDDEETASETEAKYENQDKDKSEEGNKSLTPISTPISKEEKAPPQQKLKKSGSGSGKSLPKMYI
ncbi:VrrA/YqfQ family protein [Terribacillus saccharophilus]|uniref:VrrA/YqfQ family protein n=1 Tax=Terribacillus saccharophilus TaxID=361277 RepID=UPI000C9A2934|nr:VrrA/YqfQ family protein [Terribacillus goriensis]